MLKLASMMKEDLELLYARANGYLANGSPGIAENLYHKILSLGETGVAIDPETEADVLHNLGMIAEERLNFDLAIDYYQKAVTLNKQRSMTWLFLAKLLLNRFERLQSKLDLKAGLEAVAQAEANNSHYPVIRLLKEKYKPS